MIASAPARAEQPVGLFGGFDSLARRQARSSLNGQGAGGSESVWLAR